ncbi:unnamed protein product [Durusdinium trenchii]|uniref:Uncharacterized protein n=1 Tax=Durusdinium trenchii TaxID=1381693 RepID=A0ABP0MI22_9DINO
MRPESKELELEPAEPTPQAVVHQIFSNCIPETHVCKELLGEVLTQIGISKADADALLLVVNSGSSQVSYEDFVKFVFPPPKEQVVRRRRKMSWVRWRSLSSSAIFVASFKNLSTGMMKASQRNSCTRS